MRKTESRLIGETTYVVKQLGAKQGLLVLARLANVLAPLAASGLNKWNFEGVKFNGPELVDMAEIFVSSTKIKQTLQDNAGSQIELPFKDTWEDHFPDHWDELGPYVLFCLEVNYASFLAGKSVQLSELKEKVKSLWNSQAGAIGASGVSSQAPASQPIS